MVLTTNHDELRDIVTEQPELVDATSGERTGIRLMRWLGAGGMATVFEAERDVARRPSILSPLAPARLAIKINRLSTERQLARLNLEPMQFVKKELIALSRVMDRKPPTEFVVGFYGSGTVDVALGEHNKRIPWLALELVDGGSEGATLGQRVLRAAKGIDPVRALRLTRGVLSGVGVLHEAGIVHRDLKPENIFVTGPLDDETPKIADCGIARVDGLAVGTIAALTPAYAGPEQVLSQIHPTRSNPLIGPWSDIHALAALLWFLIGGEEWCRGDSDSAWHAGERRSLRTAPRLHEGFAGAASLLDELDAALARAAALRLPARAWQGEDLSDYERFARLRFDDRLFDGPERFDDLQSLSAALLPILEQLAGRWSDAAAKEGRAATVFRPTQMMSLDSVRGGETLARSRELDSRTISGTGVSLDAAAVACFCPKAKPWPVLASAWCTSLVAGPTRSPCRQSCCSTWALRNG